MLRWRQASLLICVVLLLGIMVPCLGMAEEEEPKTASGTSSEKAYNDWHILFYLPGWFAGMKGDVAVKGIKADVDVSVGQSIENLQYLQSVALGHLEVKKGPWGLLLEGIYMEMGEKVRGGATITIPILVGPILKPVQIPVAAKISASMAMSFDEADVLYDLYRSSSSTGNRAVLTIEALAGARYTYFRADFHATITAGPLASRVTVDGKRDWVDPTLGGRLSWNLSDDWMLGFRADVGGFGLSSHITWNLDAMVRYRISKCVNLNGGFRALYMDHETGSFKYDVWAYGPWLGLGVEF